MIASLRLARSSSLGRIRRLGSGLSLALFAFAVHGSAQCPDDVGLVLLDAGTTGVRLHTPDGAPVIGGSFSLRFEGGPPNATGFIVYSGFEAQVYNPDFEATLHIGSPFFVKLFETNVLGDSKKLFKVNTVDVGLCGIEIVFQAGVTDAGAPGGLSFTNGVRIRIGEANDALFHQADEVQGLGGGAIAFGDLGTDGIRDMVMADVNSDFVKVFTGDPAGGFSLTSEHFTFVEPVSVELGDLTGEGDLDVVLANNGSFRVAVFFGDGAGGLVPPGVLYDSGPVPVQTAMADFDGDGDLDVATANFPVSDGRILLNDGTGVLGAPTIFTAGDGLTDILAADMDENGDVDLVVTLGLESAVAVVLGNGDSTFMAPLKSFMGGVPTALVTGDLDGDTIPDVALVTDVGVVRVMSGDGAGGLSLLSLFVVDPDPIGLLVGDVEGNGTLDLVTLSDTPASASVLLGDGVGGFAVESFLAMYRPSSFALADANLDGNEDIVVTSVEFGATSYGVLGGTGDGSVAHRRQWISLSISNLAESAPWCREIATPGGRDRANSGRSRRRKRTQTRSSGSIPPSRDARSGQPLLQTFDFPRLAKTWHDHCFSSPNTGAMTPGARQAHRGGQSNSCSFRGRSEWFAGRKFGGSPCPRAVRSAPDLERLV